MSLYNRVLAGVISLLVLILAGIVLSGCAISGCGNPQSSNDKNTNVEYNRDEENINIDLPYCKPIPRMRKPKRMYYQAL